MIRFLSILTVLFCSTSLGYTQDATPDAYYSFDDGTASESRGSMEFDGFISGNPQIACGVEGSSLLFDGSGDYITFAGPINERFERNDFVISFYFHPTGINPRQTLLRKMEDCDEENQRLKIDYLATEGALEFIFAETSARELGGARERIPLDPTRCWHHVVLERRDREVRIYLNGTRVKRITSSTRFNITNNFNLELARSACPATESNFRGFIDEFRIYSGSLTIDQIESLYTGPDRIADVAFPVINIGATVDLTVGETCANSFTWTPVGSITSGLNTIGVTVAPVQSTMYLVEMGYPNSGCRSQDSILIQVFDPDNFDCTQLLIPSAFTPDGTGPEQNNRLGISNAATLQTFESFEIYDRWGNRVFQTGDSSEEWDGTYQGDPAMPGIYLWHVSYGCNNDKLEKSGSVTLIR